MSSSSRDSDNDHEPSSTVPDTTASYELLSTLGVLKANFACGGSLQVMHDYEVPSDFPTVSGRLHAPPIAIRWDGQAGRKITFPVGDLTHGQSSIDELMADCVPATFGHKGKDILDSSYRHASKLDNTQFSTNFHPHDYGILSAIAQILLPGIARSDLGGQNKAMEHFGVAAELYKLNIYSGPSGKFMAHVDTPRGPRQFGSLVVCLPFSHQGGQLQIMHGGHEITYDWSNDNSKNIEWAAFYSDCKHEVFEVKSGHRVTLTYNLYISEHTGSPIQLHPFPTPSTYPLYNKAKSLLQNPNFMKKGGILGLYCVHKYAHTNSESIARLPYALKGVDAIFCAIFCNEFGLDVNIHPVLDDYRKQEAELYDYDGEELSGDIVGTGCHELSINDMSTEECRTAEVLEEGWPNEQMDVQWINGPHHKEVAHIYMAYGNETSLAWHYSALAILIQVPSFTERVARIPEVGFAGSGEGATPQ